MIRRLPFTFWGLMLLLPGLAACGAGEEKKIRIGDDFDLGRQNAVHVSERQKKALVSLFNSGVPIKSVRWPSNAVITLFANDDIYKGFRAPLPTRLAQKYGRDENTRRAAWLVYQRSVARGLDKPLIDTYFKSPMGRRELHGTYVLLVARSCYKDIDKVPDDILQQIKTHSDAGGKLAFTCPHKPALRSRPLPL